MAEIAGVALAVLPIVVNVAESFCTVQNIFKRFRGFGPEVKLFQLQLKIQRTIFREECRQLIARVAGQENASDMLANVSHPLWKDKSFDKEMSAYLGTLAEGCTENILLVEKRLRSIESEGQELTEMIGGPDKKHSHRKRIQERIKFAFSESTLDRNLRKIQDLNVSLRQMTDQLSKRHEPRPTGVNQISREQRKNIERFRLVQNVSTHLYKALGTACTVHKDHVAHISLDPTLAEGKDPQVCFSVSFCPLTNLTVTGTTSLDDPVWVSIESIVKTSIDAGSSNVNVSLSAVNQTRKRGSQPNLNGSCSAQKRIKVVRFVDSHSPPMTVAVPATSPMSQVLRPNFCTRIRNCKRHSDNPSICLGPLDENSIFEHRVYIPSQTTVENHKQISSLEQMFGTVSSTTRMPLYEKCRYSRLLATALLQFNATPWLTRTWRCQDILISKSLANVDDSNSTARKVNLASLYANVPVRAIDNSATLTANDLVNTFAPNAFLFSLGVIMLEIAFESPIRSMRKAVDVDQCLDDRYTDFFTARRLNDTSLVSTQMGLRFSEVVRKCIHCDFGRGHDLNKPELQEGVYREVVCELSALEAKFRELQLGP